MWDRHRSVSLSTRDSKGERLAVHSSLHQRRQRMGCDRELRPIFSVSRLNPAQLRPYYDSAGLRCNPQKECDQPPRSSEPSSPPPPVSKSPTTIAPRPVSRAFSPASNTRCRSSGWICSSDDVDFSSSSEYPSIFWYAELL